MKGVLIVCLGVLLLALGSWLALRQMEGQWTGVDESVVERFAKEAGHPPQAPYINTDQGDMLLFVFAVAGACGGFVAGYCFRELFSLKEDNAGHDTLV
jgi:cobalt/nickel transport system permease protein/cobalt/nickel transport protein